MAFNVVIASGRTELRLARVTGSEPSTPPSSAGPTSPSCSSAPATPAWAIGDAQHALRQGRVVGDNVAATLSGGSRRPFRYRTLGVFVDMGQHKAVATMLGIPLRGLPAARVPGENVLEGS